MVAEIREMRGFDCDEAAALLQAHGEETCKTLDAAKLRQIIGKHRGLSLVAQLEGKIVGVALATRKDSNGFIQFVIIEPGAGETLSRQLANACSAKLAHTAIGKCKIRLATSDAADAFWQDVKWTDCPELEQPVRYYKVINDATNPDDPTCPWNSAKGEGEERKAG